METASRHRRCRDAGREILPCRVQIPGPGASADPVDDCLVILAIWPTSMHREPIVPDHEIAGR